MQVAKINLAHNTIQYNTSVSDCPNYIELNPRNSLNFKSRKDLTLEEIDTRYRRYFWFVITAIGGIGLVLSGLSGRNPTQAAHELNNHRIELEGCLRNLEGYIPYLRAMVAAGVAGASGLLAKVTSLAKAARNELKKFPSKEE